MLPMQRLALALAIGLCAGVASADPIVIEERSLSGGDQSSKPAVAVAPPPAAAPTPAPAPAAPAQNANWELYQQVQQLQDQVQQLQGQVEEQNHTIERLRSDDKSRYGDLDQRLNSLNDKLGQLQQNPAPAAGSAAVPAVPVAQPPAPSGNVDEEKKAYLAAYDVFRNQGPDKAIPPMLAFVGRYPASIFTPNAYYWLGEFYLAANPANMAEARRHFETVLSKYPDSPKAAAALYKLGTIADMQNRNDDAKKIMHDVLTRFPSSPEAALAQAYLNPPPEPKPATPAPAPAPAKKKKAPPA